MIVLLSFRETAHLSPLLITCIPAKSAPPMVSLREEYTLHLLNMLITSFRNSLVSCWFSELQLIPVHVTVGDFLSKIVNENQFFVGIHHILDFWKYEILYYEILYQKLFFQVNL